MSKNAFPKAKVRGVINHSNYASASLPIAEINLGISNTVPDMSLSLRTLIDRHNSGGKVKTFQPTYLDSDTSIPVDLERLDSVDRAMLARAVADNIASTRGKLLSQRQAREAAARDEEIQRLAALRFEQMNSVKESV